MRKINQAFHWVFLLALMCSNSVFAQVSYPVKLVKAMPIIDGDGADTQWNEISEVKVKDVVANHDLFFSAVHDGENIAIRIRFPDATENREHKTLVWNEAESIYKTGPKREDTMVMKWPVNRLNENITLDSNQPYQADIWYWKSFRTDPLGYADDKHQIYSKAPNKKATKLRAKDGTLFFLQRKGDAGSSTYKTRIILEKTNNEVAKYDHRQPSGSRADIKAKGGWKDGFWTVEFLRKLKTGNGDDIQLEINQQALVGLSRYEIAGRKPDNTIDEPLFGSGEIGKLIRLSFEQ